MPKNKHVLVQLLLIVFVAGVLSGFSAASPDGLERVAEDLGFITQAQDHSSILSDYNLPFINNPYLSAGLAGILGCAVVFCLVFGLGYLLKAHSGRKI
ncbi:PDGLE domain-containing protein [Desulforamulus hydrothermalis]|uniref:PDGLE domain-containing protein n=1 Tax=Desulforamulus hydrothermalis Lam5 = DSM 18033 TaxID=1121428 RepID=K8DX09_9FIRM|nr:PDGLE domain-containing protein [Desulforamulus hydrothermalis]CCO06935.1 conserved exported hypothetical protein [Desulforamulus hydrothermalis Lam5 = DSM 18033]SHG99168.1 cobalt/nickel transport protein [Desulforamulus hydrothermalis Lam5 = DSM 18033]